MAFLNFNKAELVNLSYSLKREIISANKTGAYCNTTIVTCNTRRYHGLLAVPVDNFGSSTYLLLSSLDETLVIGGKPFNLGIHCYGNIYEPRGHKYIVDFEADPVPRITYKVGEVVLAKSLLLVPDKDAVMVKYDLVSAPADVEIQLKPFLAFRNVHSLTHQNPEARTGYKEVENGVSFCLYEGFPDLNLQLNTSRFKYESVPVWYNGVTYSDEARRGFECTEDLFVPGYFTTHLKEGKSVILSASVEEIAPRSITRIFNSGVAKEGEITSIEDRLEHAADLFITDRNGHKQICAGFSWLFTGLLRETLCSLPGLTLYANGDRQTFEEILDNLIADEQERLFSRTTQVEAPLMLPEVLQQYIDFGAAPAKVWKKYGETVKGIIKSYAPGVRNEVTLHPNGLLWAQMDHVALSWMNAYIGGEPVTERPGYQVETNAFWYNALSFALSMERRYGKFDSDFVRDWEPVRSAAEENYTKIFWNPQKRYLADYVDNYGQHMEVRPNMLCALSVPESPVDPEIFRSVRNVVKSELLTSRGLRSLSPRDPQYKGVYEGTQRDRDLAYFGGSVRPYLLFPYCSVSFKMRGEAFLGKAKWLVEGLIEDLNKHGVGAISELYDGDPPHEPHGAISSALSTAAILGVRYLINKYKEEQ